jgi:hypothetical protein
LNTLIKKFYVTSDQKQGEQACRAHSLSLQKKVVVGSIPIA